MPTFDTLRNQSDHRALIRKIQKAMAFLAPVTVALPTSLFDVDGSLIDLKPLGYMPFGIVTPDGYGFNRELNKEDVSGLGYAGPVRSDTTSVVRSITLSPLEHGRRHLMELKYGTNLTSTKQDATTGEVVFDEPDLPIGEEYRLLVIGKDGPASAEWILGRGYGRVKLASTDTETWGQEGAVQSPLTLDVFTDDVIGTPLRHFMGGTGAKANKALLGYANAWTATTAFVLGERVFLTGNAILEATVAGTSAAVAPTAPALGATVVDGSVTWKRIA